MRVQSLFLLFSLCVGYSVLSAADELPTTREAAYELLKPFTGKSNPGINTTTIKGKVVTGYQGWFNTPDDGAGRGYTHYNKKGKFIPGMCSIDAWPDVSELPVADQFPTEFRHKDGSVAKVFSSYRRSTVQLHFKWMQEYGIDAAFIQRFASETANPKLVHHRNTVLKHAQEAANQFGRGYILMYDLSGLKSDTFHRVEDDWKMLVDHMKLSKDKNDKAYMSHNGKPLVAIWGIGFSDDRGYSLADCEKLIDFLKNDPVYGGNAIMIGVPYYWRERTRDAVSDEALHRIIKKVDIISPWAVGRFSVNRSTADMVKKTIAPDVKWCADNKIDYLPVVFPGFSWYNLQEGKAQFNHIPRQGGDFIWRQSVAAKQGGANMIYIAMFDEIDEGTAIIKLHKDPPVGPSLFISEPDIPNDHYLWLAGQMRHLLSGKIPAQDEQPKRKP